MSPGGGALRTAAGSLNRRRPLRSFRVTRPRRLPRHSPMNRLAAALLVLATLILGGCSTGYQLAYANLERLALWQLGDYIALDDAQKVAFRSEFAALKAWHYHQQRPEQVAGLRRLAAAIEHGVAADQAVLATLDVIDTDAQALWKQARPGIERLLASLDDDQIAEYDRRTLKRIDKRRREQAKASPAERRERWLDDWGDRLERWLGKPNEAQRRLLAAAWDAEQPFLLDPDAAADDGRASHQRFLGLLANRDQPGLGERLEDEARHRNRTRDDAEQARQRALIGALFAAADGGQRRHFVAAVRKLADQLDTLNAPAASATDAAA